MSVFFLILPIIAALKMSVFFFSFTHYCCPKNVGLFLILPIIAALKMSVFF